MERIETESSQLELKLTLPSHDQILKTVCGFANQFGGKLIIGVANDGEIVGVKEKLAIDWLQYLDQLIIEGIAPLIVPKIYTNIVEGCLLVIIEVPRGSQKPYYIRNLGIHEGVYIRLGPTTHKAPLEYINELQWQSRGRSYDTTPLFQVDREELDEKRLTQFFERRSKSPVSVTGKLLESYQILLREQNVVSPSVGGLLLFSQDPQKFLPEAFAICTSFKALDMTHGAFRTRDIRGDLFEQIEGIMSFLTENLNTDSVLKSVRREDRLELPELALREAVVNALIHRSYAIQSPIKVAVFPNRVEIFSPGSFPGPINTKALEFGLSYVRNTLLTRIFRESGIAEKLGSGLRRIVETFKEAGLAPPQFIEGSGYVKVTLPRGRIELNPESLRLTQVLAENGTVSLEMIAKSLKLSTKTTLKLLNDLIEGGRVKREGKARATRYRLT